MKQIQKNPQRTSSGSLQSPPLDLDRDSSYLFPNSSKPTTSNFNEPTFQSKSSSSSSFKPSNFTPSNPNPTQNYYNESSKSSTSTYNPKPTPKATPKATPNPPINYLTPTPIPKSLPPRNNIVEKQSSQSSQGKESSTTVT
jgi:hypothetical protein